MDLLTNPVSKSLEDIRKDFDQLTKRRKTKPSSNPVQSQGNLSVVT